MVHKVSANTTSSSSTSTLSHRRSNSNISSTPTTTKTMIVDPLSLSDHDDSSVSSTISVDHLPRKELHVSSSEESTSRKRMALVKKHVSFDLSRTVYHDDNSASDMEEDDDDENDSAASTAVRWYTAQEYREFKSLAQDASNQIVRIEARNRAPYSYQRVMEHVYTSCVLHPATASSSSTSVSVLPESELVHLQRWLDVATSRLGLEKWSIRKITRDKSYRRRELVKTVMNLQGTYRQQQNQQHSSFLSLSLNPNETMVTVDTIRIACETISQPSRLYAQTMATALASAVASSSQSIDATSQ